MKYKTCTKCNNPYPATKEYFSSDKRHKDNLRSQCRECDKHESALYYQYHSKQKREYYQKTRNIRLQKAKERYGTIEGYLRSVYSNIKKRIVNPVGRDLCYKDVKLQFTFDEFVDCVINVLKVDPRGLEIHRIDSNGHYKCGNIEFLTSKEHGLKHRRKNDYKT